MGNHKSFRTVLCKKCYGLREDVILPERWGSLKKYWEDVTFGLGLVRWVDIFLGGKIGQSHPGQGQWFKKRKGGKELGYVWETWGKTHDILLVLVSSRGVGSGVAEGKVRDVKLGQLRHKSEIPGEGGTGMKGDKVSWPREALIWSFFLLLLQRIAISPPSRWPSRQNCLYSQN